MSYRTIVLIVAIGIAIWILYQIVKEKHGPEIWGRDEESRWEE